jgi:hypothetical protein
VLTSGEDAGTRPEIGGGGGRRAAGNQLGPTAAAGASEAGRRLGHARASRPRLYRAWQPRLACHARHSQGGGTAGRFDLDWPMGFGGPGWAGAGRAFGLGPLG